MATTPGALLRTWSVDELRPLYHVSILSNDQRAINSLLKNILKGKPAILIGGGQDEKFGKEGKDGKDGKECLIRVEGKEEDKWVKEYLKKTSLAAHQVTIDARKLLEKEMALQSADAGERIEGIICAFKERAVREGWPEAELKSRLLIEKEAEEAAQRVRTEKMKSWYYDLREKSQAAKTNTVIVFNAHSKIPTNGNDEEEEEEEEDEEEEDEKHCVSHWSRFVQNARHYLTQLITIMPKTTLSSVWLWSVDVVFVDPNLKTEWTEDDLGLCLSKEEWETCLRTAKSENKWIVRLVRSPSLDFTRHLAIFPK